MHPLLTLLWPESAVFVVAPLGLAVLDRGVFDYDAAAVTIGDSILGEEFAVDAIWTLCPRSRFTATFDVGPGCCGRSYTTGKTLGLTGIRCRCQQAGAADAAVRCLFCYVSGVLLSFTLVRRLKGWAIVRGTFCAGFAQYDRATVSDLN